MFWGVPTFGGAGKRLLLKLPVAPDLRPSRRRARRRRETLIEGVVEVLLLVGDLEGVPFRLREAGAAGVRATGDGAGQRVVSSAGQVLSTHWWGVTLGLKTLEDLQG